MERTIVKVTHNGRTWNVEAKTPQEDVSTCPDVWRIKHLTLKAGETFVADGGEAMCVALNVPSGWRVLNATCLSGICNIRCTWGVNPVQRYSCNKGTAHMCVVLGCPDAESVTFVY